MEGKALRRKQCVYYLSDGNMNSVTGTLIRPLAGSLTNLCGAQLAFYSTATGGPFPGGEMAGACS